MNPVPWRRNKTPGSRGSGRRETDAGSASISPPSARRARRQPETIADPRSVIGLDFGTTNSCAAFINARGEPGRVRVSTGNEPYDTVLASIVLDPAGGDPILGLEASAARARYPDATYLRYFKHLLDAQRLRELQSRRRVVRTGRHDFVTETELVKEVEEWVPVGGEHSREDLVQGAARILERLLRSAVSQGADRDASLWLGIPVSFSGWARKRLICALDKTRDEDGKPFFDGYREILRRVHFVLEPVAVAAAAGEELEVTGRQKVLVFDHGGGTLDLSVIEFEERPGFMPAPVRELAAGGASDVAGSHLDDAFAELLLGDPEVRAALADFDDYTRREVIEDCKKALSTNQRADLRLAGMQVPREALEEAIAPILGRIEDEVGRTLAGTGLGPSDIDWVVMTGGSSLVPAVQRRMMAMFPDATERGQFFRYFPEDTAPGGGVELAVTDVAQGLARFGQQEALEQIVLWDVELGRDNTGEFEPLFQRGTPYEVGEDGRPALSKIVPAPDVEDDGACFALYEQQLDRRFLFGLADAPPLPDGAYLRIELRRDSLFPALAILNDEGKVLAQHHSPTGWPHDRLLMADIEDVPDNQLEEFFDGDGEYLPDLGFERFSQAPLVRPLRERDYIEWTRREGTNGGWINRRGRGEIIRIRKIGSDESIKQMSSWDVSEFTFTVRDADRGGTLELRCCNGSLRLAPRPGRKY